jgi:hypothetical protein
MQNTAYNQDGPRWATLQQAASYCGLCQRTIEMAASDGLVVTSHVRRTGASRGRTLVDLRSLDRWIEDGIGKKADLPHLNVDGSNREEDSHEE